MKSAKLLCPKTGIQRHQILRRDVFLVKYLHMAKVWWVVGLLWLHLSDKRGPIDQSPTPSPPPLLPFGSNISNSMRFEFELGQ